MICSQHYAVAAEVAARTPKRRVTAPPPKPIMEAPPEPVIETTTIESFVEPNVAETCGGSRVGCTSEPHPEPAQPVFREPEILQSEPVIEENLPPREMPEEPPLVEVQMEEEIEPAPQPRAPRIIPPKKKPLIAPKAEAESPNREKAAAARQEVLQFEPLTRGRFEKSEPTIVEGQDLDVPTFLRKNIRVK